MAVACRDARSGDAEQRTDAGPGPSGRSCTATGVAPLTPGQSCGLSGEPLRQIVGTARLPLRAMVIVVRKSQGKPNLTNRRSACKTRAFCISCPRLGRARLRLLHRDT